MIYYSSYRGYDRSRFAGRCCPDPNCDGQLEYERDGYWHCNGLAHNQGDTRVSILLPKDMTDQVLFDNWVPKEN